MGGVTGVTAGGVSWPPTPTAAPVAGVTGETVYGGIYHAADNPDGEVLDPGYLYEVRHIADFRKGSNAMLELVAIVKL